MSLADFKSYSGVKSTSSTSLINYFLNYSLKGILNNVH